MLAALEYLSELAKKKRLVQASTFDLAKAAHSLANPRSLRWRNALSSASRTFDFVRTWITRLKP
jgi:hypothetical protein